MINYKVMYISYLMLNSEHANFILKSVESRIKESDSGSWSWRLLLLYLANGHLNHSYLFFSICSSIWVVFNSPSLIESLIAFGEKSAFS